MVDAVRSRLEVVRQKIAGNDRLTPGPVLSEDELAAFERDNGVRLPEDYRLFLQIVGNGVDGRSRGFSVLYPILPLGTWFEEPEGPHASRRVIRGDLRRPFPLTDAVDYEEQGYPEPGEGPAAGGTAPGKVFVCEIGCGDYWILVVNGPERGNMWVEGYGGYQPIEPRTGFLDWCEHWADLGWTEDSSGRFFGADDDD
jgi:hypothetical protein